jgi:hypothetical protein
MKLNRNETINFLGIGSSLFSSSFLLNFLLNLLLFFWCLGFFFKLFQSVHGDFGSGGNASSEFISSSSECNLTSFTFPDSA